MNVFRNALEEDIRVATREPTRHARQRERASPPQILSDHQRVYLRRVPPDTHVLIGIRKNTRLDKVALRKKIANRSRLLDIVHNRRFGAIVWLVDDLGEFLAGTGQKAVRNDAAFLEFVGQRSKIAPLYVLATTGTAADQVSGR